MKNLKPIIGILAVLLTACGGLTDEQLSQKLLEEAQVHFAKKEVNAAKLLIDSIHTTYPKIVKTLRMADTLSWRIEQFEIDRNLPYIDSMLMAKTEEFEAQKKLFRFEKDDKYQDVGNFVIKSQKTEANVDRNYVKPYTDENGNFYVMSYYIGSKLQHNALRANVGELFAETETVSPADVHEYNDGGVHREMVLFLNDMLGGFPQFIAENEAEKVKITLLGKRSYSYFLPQSDKEAFLKTFRLSSLLKDMREMRLQQKKMQLRQLQLTQKLQ